MPTLDASVALKVSAGTPSGRTLRVRGRGVPARRTGARAGDLLVTVDVAVPAHLNNDARSALEQFAAAEPGDPRPQITAALAKLTPSSAAPSAAAPSASTPSASTPGGNGG